MLLGGLLGGLLSTGTELAKGYFEGKKEQNRFDNEYKLRQLEQQGLAEQERRNLDAMVTQASINAEAEAFVASEATNQATVKSFDKMLSKSPRWVTAVAGLVRPYITLIMVKLYAAITIYLCHKVDTAGGDTRAIIAVLEALAFTEFVGFIFVFWFNNRSIDKKKKR